MHRVVKRITIIAFLFLGACASDPPNPNPRANAPVVLAQVDLPRYMGRWYNIAHVPYILERGYVGSISEWTLRADGQIDDVFVAHKGSFDAPETRKSFVDSVDADSHGAHWHVHLFGPITVSQLTLYVDPNYQYTILGDEEKHLGWIFSRSNTMSDATYRELLSRLDQIGYDTSRFRRVPQRPEDIGKEGYLKADE